MAFNEANPANDELLINAPSQIRANWESLKSQTEAALQITNAKVADAAGIVDTKLAQITTAGKVSGSAITLLANVPSGAGVLPIANVPTIPGSKLGTLNTISSGAGKIPVANMPDETVKTTGDQTVGGVKTFSSLPVIPETPISDGHPTSKKYIETLIDTDGELTANSDTKVPSQKAVKTYVDAKPSAYSTGLGAWVSRSKDTTYLAETDGFVIAYTDYPGSAGLTLEGKTDTSNPPTTVRAFQQTGQYASGFISFPVLNGNRWRVECGRTTTVWWVPIS